MSNPLGATVPMYVATGLKTVLAQIEAVVYPYGWDQPARLFQLDSCSVGQLPAVEVLSLPVPDRLRTAHPVRIMNGLAGALHTTPGPALLDWFARTVAFAVVFEAWGLIIDPRDEATAEARRGEAQAHRLHLHPERHEARFVWMSGHGGVEAGLQRRRGEDDNLVFSPDLSAHAGAVVDSLRRLWRACERAQSGASTAPRGGEVT